MTGIMLHDTISPLQLKELTTHAKSEVDMLAAI